MQLAIVCNSLPPYRVHFHRRIASECSDIQLHTLVTHDDSRWPNRMIPEIGTVMFGHNEVLNGNRLRQARNDLRIGGRIINYLQQHNINAVIVNGYNDPGRLRVIRWCHAKHIPVFLWSDSNIHGDRATGLKRFIKKQLVTRVVRACTGILVCGRYGRQYYEQYGATPDHITYIPYEPDYSVIQSITQEEIDQAIARYGLSDQGPRVLFCGRFVDAKRPDLVIEAFNAAAAADHPNATLIMAGQGPLEQSLRERVAPELRCRVYWTGFIEDEREMAALFRACDIMVLPSQYEPWALVVNEAAAAGLAIIASQVVGAAAELVNPGENGSLIPANNLAELTDSLKRLLAEPTTLQAYRNASAAVLNNWRINADPVAGVKAILKSP